MTGAFHACTHEHFEAYLAKAEADGLRFTARVS